MEAISGTIAGVVSTAAAEGAAATAAVGVAEAATPALAAIETNTLTSLVAPAVETTSPILAPSPIITPIESSLPSPTLAPLPTTPEVSYDLPPLSPLSPAISESSIPSAIPPNISGEIPTVSSLSEMKPVSEPLPAEAPSPLATRQFELQEKQKNHTITMQEQRELRQVRDTLERQEFDQLVDRMTNPQLQFTQEDMRRYLELKLKADEKKHHEQSEESPEPAEMKKQKLDQELDQIRHDMATGKISSQEGQKKIQENQQKRQLMVDNLVHRLEKGDKNMSSFERQVAEKGLQMQQLFAEVQHSPQMIKDMVQELRNLKDEYRTTGKMVISKDTIDTKAGRKNVAERAQIADQIRAQSEYIAKYADITDYNVNEFLSVNSSLESLIGTRSLLHDLVVQIGTGIKSELSSGNIDIRARLIAKAA